MLLIGEGSCEKGRAVVFGDFVAQLAPTTNIADINNQRKYNVLLPIEGRRIIRGSPASIASTTSPSERHFV